MADGDIDLYADVEEFPSGELEQESNDLYDDVLAAAEPKEEKPDKPAAGASTSTAAAAPASHAPDNPARRYQLYIGNLTWWTTDQDIQDAVQELGVTDFMEVKFYENRANGQSKGFCCISLGSESSMKLVMEKLPTKELHEQTPAVTYATKQALNHFESQSKTRPPQQGPPPPSNGRGPPFHPGGPPRSLMGPGSRGPPPVRPPPAFNRPPPGIRGPPPGGPPPIHHRSGPPPIMGGPPPHAPPGPAPHVNPAFFPAGGHAAGYPPSHVPSHGLSEQEFEEIMSRNRTVSSSAIARAVQDASTGEYASAIETLVTAISLIKQSKVAQDDRCKILVSSLQDTLHGIENKSYGSRGGVAGGGGSHHPPPHRRDRSRSRERDHYYPSTHHHREYREYRGRSRERDHHHHHHHREYYDRPRSREREHYHERRARDDKYYEERERYKERMAMESRSSSSSRLDERGDGRSGDRERSRRE